MNVRQRAVGKRAGRPHRPQHQQVEQGCLGAAHVESLGDHRNRHFQDGEHGTGGGDGGEHEEQHHEQVAERNAGKHRRYGDEQQGGTGCGLKAEGEYRREDGDAGQHGDEQIGAHHPEGGQRDILIIPKVAAIGHHAAHADGEFEEGEPHGGQHHPGGDLGEIRREQKVQPLAGPGQGQAADADDQQQDEEHRHQLLGDRLDPLGDPHQQDASHQDQHQPLPEQALQWVAYQRPEGRPGHLGIGRQDGAVNGLEDVGKDPGRHFGVEGHDKEGGQHPHQGDQPPGLPLGGQLAEGGDGVGLAFAPQHDLRDHHRQADQQGGDDIDQQETGAAVFARQVGKLPDISQPDG